MTFYAGMAAVATRLIAKFGAAGSVIEQVTARDEYGEATETPTTHAVTCVALADRRFETDPNSSGQQGIKILIAPGAYTPKAGDTVSIHSTGQQYRVHTAEVIEPADTQCLYILRAGRA